MRHVGRATPGPNGRRSRAANRPAGDRIDRGRQPDPKRTATRRPGGPDVLDDREAGETADAGEAGTEGTADPRDEAAADDVDRDRPFEVEERTEENRQADGERARRRDPEPPPTDLERATRTDRQVPRREPGRRAERHEDDAHRARKPFTQDRLVVLGGDRRRRDSSSLHPRRERRRGDQRLAETHSAATAITARSLCRRICAIRLSPSSAPKQAAKSVHSAQDGAVHRTNPSASQSLR